MLLLIASLVALSSTACARFGGIQDVDSFPKYSVSFLNALPVTNETAQSWLQHGLAGGESEFLEAAPTPSLKRIESGDEPSEYQNSGSPQVRRLPACQRHTTCHVLTRLFPPPGAARPASAIRRRSVICVSYTASAPAPTPVRRARARADAVKDLGAFAAAFRQMFICAPPFHVSTLNINHTHTC